MADYEVRKISDIEEVASLKGAKALVTDSTNKARRVDLTYIHDIALGAENNAKNGPKIVDGEWYVFDYESGEYKATGVTVLERDEFDALVDLLNSMWYFDDNGVLRTNYPIASQGYAAGATATASEGGSGVGIILTTWDGYDSTKAGYALSAGLGKEMYDRITVLEGAGYATQSWVEGKGYLLTDTAETTYQKIISASNKIPYSYISGTPTIPTSLKNPHALTFGSKTYDGSEAQTIAASDLGALTSHQTIYALTIKNSAGTTVLSYTPNNIAGSLTLTKAMVGLSNVENTALSTWAGTDNITTLGTITSGTWQGEKIGLNYLYADHITIAGTEVKLGRAISKADLLTNLGLNTLGEMAFVNKSALSVTINGTAVSPLGGSFNTAEITGGGVGSTLPTSGYTLDVPYFTVNDYGVITSTGTHKHTISNIPNSSLANSSITIGGTSVSLGGSVTASTLLTSIMGSSALGSTSSYLYWSGTAWATKALGTLAFSSTAYAGGTAVTLNGTSKASSTASFYAPTSAGTSGQLLVSTGGAPSWVSKSSISLSAFDDDVVAGKYQPLSTAINTENIGSQSVHYATSAGNADAATKLATARTIWGQSFDGTANVSGALSGVTNINSALYLSTSGNIGIGTTEPSYKLDVAGSARLSAGSALYIGDARVILRQSDGVTYYGTADLASNTVYISGKDIYFRYNGTSVGLAMRSTGNVLIGQSGDTGLYKLDVAGAGRFTGAVTLASTLAVTGAVAFSSSVKIGDATLSWDATNGVLKIDKPIASQGYAAGATATSAGTSGGGDFHSREDRIVQAE